MKHYNIVSTGIVKELLLDKSPREWTKQALIILEESTQVYWVEIIAESHLEKQ